MVNYSRAVELARSFEREVPRTNAVIAIGRAVLQDLSKDRLPSFPLVLLDAEIGSCFRNRWVFRVPEVTCAITKA